MSHCSSTSCFFPSQGAVPSVYWRRGAGRSFSRCRSIDPLTLSEGNMGRCCPHLSTSSGRKTVLTALTETVHQKSWILNSQLMHSCVHCTSHSGSWWHAELISMYLSVYFLTGPDPWTQTPRQVMHSGHTHCSSTRPCPGSLCLLETRRRAVLPIRSIDPLTLSEGNMGRCCPHLSTSSGTEEDCTHSFDWSSTSLGLSNGVCMFMCSALQCGSWCKNAELIGMYLYVYYLGLILLGIGHLDPYIIIID